jgi:hypothetical protein
MSSKDSKGSERFCCVFFLKKIVAAFNKMEVGAL